MAGTRTLKSSKISFKLNYGKNPDTGNDVIKTLSLTDMVGTPDATKVISVSKLLSPCLEKEIARVEHTRVDTITEV